MHFLKELESDKNPSSPTVKLYLGLEGKKKKKSVIVIY